MPANVKRFATCSVEIGDDLVGKLTQYGKSTTVSEEMVSGAEDATTADNAILEKYIPVSVGKTANVGGVALKDDVGQSALETAADAATENIILKFRNADGSGEDQTGFFTNFEESGELSANVFRFTGQFRVNSKTPVAAPTG